MGSTGDDRASERGEPCRVLGVPEVRVSRIQMPQHLLTGLRRKVFDPVQLGASLGQMLNPLPAPAVPRRTTMDGSSGVMLRRSALQGQGFATSEAYG
jgi:hypothetical protein